MGEIRAALYIHHHTSSYVDRNKLGKGAPLCYFLLINRNIYSGGIVLITRS
jgi:hypothetical protein